MMVSNVQTRHMDGDDEIMIMSSSYAISNAPAKLPANGTAINKKPLLSTMPRQTPVLRPMNQKITMVLPKTLVDMSSPPNVANRNVSPIKKKFIKVDRKTATPAAHPFWAAPPPSSVEARPAFGAGAGASELAESISANSMSSSDSEGA
jgi:hypothetical protein